MSHHEKDEKHNVEPEEAEEELAGGGGGGCHGCFGYCAFADRHRVFTIVSFAAIGLGVGVGLSYWDPIDSESKTVAIQWIGLIGDLFLRALKCVVLPVRCHYGLCSDKFPSVIPSASHGLLTSPGFTSHLLSSPSCSLSLLMSSSLSLT
jgi:hypothetical protein